MLLVSFKSSTHTAYYTEKSAKIDDLYTKLVQDDFPDSTKTKERNWAHFFVLQILTCMLYRGQSDCYIFCWKLIGETLSNNLGQKSNQLHFYYKSIV